MILVLGVDGLSYPFIKQNKDELSFLWHLLESSDLKIIRIDPEQALSPVMWTTIFTGTWDHGIRGFIIRENGKERLATKKDVGYPFLWEVAEERGYKAIAISVPALLPPINFRIQCKLIEDGLSWEYEKALANMILITRAIKKAIQERPDLLVAVYTSIDRICHRFWGEPKVLEAYSFLEEELSKVLSLLKKEDKLLIVSDHGFRSWEGGEVEGILKRWTEEGEIKGDHDPECVVAVKGMSQNNIEDMKDIFWYILKELQL